MLSCGKFSSVSQELTAFAIRVDRLAFHTKCRVDHARALVGQWELGWKSGVQENKWGPLKTGYEWSKSLFFKLGATFHQLWEVLHWVTIVILFFSTCFINLGAFEFSTTGKVTAHFEANSQSIIAG